MIYTTGSTLDQLLLCGNCRPFTFKFKNMEYKCETVYAELISDFVIQLHRSDPLADSIEFGFDASSKYFEIFNQFLNGIKYSIQNIHDTFQFFIGIGSYDIAYDILSSVPANGINESIDKFIQLLKYPFRVIDSDCYPNVDSKTLSKIPVEGLYLLLKNPSYEDLNTDILSEIGHKHSSRKLLAEEFQASSNSRPALSTNSLREDGSRTDVLIVPLNDLPSRKMSRSDHHEWILFDTTNAPPIAGIIIKATNCKVNFQVRTSIDGLDSKTIFSGEEEFTVDSLDLVIHFEETEITQYEYIQVDYRNEVLNENDSHIKITLFTGLESLLL